MRRNVLTASFARALLAGFVAGIVSVIANFGYILFYRAAIGGIQGAISPLILFVGIPALMVVCGLLFFWLKRYVYKGTLWYSVLFILFVLFFIFIGLMAPGEISLEGYKGALIGVELITGLVAIFLVPYFARLLSIFRTPQGLYDR